MESHQSQTTGRTQRRRRKMRKKENGTTTKSSWEEPSKSGGFRVKLLKREFVVVCLLLLLPLSETAAAKNVNDLETARPHYMNETMGNGTGYYLNHLGQIQYGQFPTTNMSASNYKIHVRQQAEHCICHRGAMWCDGYLPYYPYEQKPMHKHGHICVIIPDAPCVGGDTELNCEVHSHLDANWNFGWSDIALAVVITAAVVVVVTLAMLKCCTTGVVIMQPRPWCRWNYLLVLLLIMINWKRGVAKVMQPGSCSDGLCLRACYRVGECVVAGYSVQTPSYKWESGAWCWHHDCCKEAARMDISKCSNGDYGWAAGCGLARKGCWWCGVRILGKRTQIIQCTTKKKRCELTKGGQVTHIDAVANAETKFYAPELNCEAREPHVNNAGIWKWDGEFSCNCPDPWHCGVVGGIREPGICKSSSDVEYKDGHVKVGISTAEEVDVSLPKCATSNTQYPCEKEGKFCWDNDCRIKQVEQSSSKVEQLFEGLSGVPWLSDLFPNWFGWISPLYVVIAILIIILLVK